MDRTGSSRNSQLFALAIVAGICLAGYTFLSVASNHDAGIELFQYLVAHWTIAAAIFAYWYYLYRTGRDISISALIVWAIIFRLTGIMGSPMLEDDFYRYLLDGCNFIDTGSPYGITPESLFHGNTLSSECQSALNWVNNPDLPTIYGPVLQYLFAFAHILSPAEATPLQAICALFDLGIIFILCKLAPARNVMLYAWNPLVLKEFAFTAHPDVVGIFFLLSAFVLLRNGKNYRAATLVALACASKIFAVLALPWFLTRRSLSPTLIFATVILALYLPFLLQGHTDMLVLGIFAEHWQFNSTGFELLRKIFPEPWARYASLIVFLAWYGYYFRRYKGLGTAPGIPRMDWVFGVFFLVSPVLNPWYVTWILPFAVMGPALWPWALSLVVTLTYITGINFYGSILGPYEIVYEALMIEIAVIGLAVLLDYRARRFQINENGRFCVP